MILIADNLKIFISTHRRRLVVGGVWLAIILAIIGTLVLSNIIRSRNYNFAGVFMSGNSVVHVIELYLNYAKPANFQVKVGETVRFVVKDEGFHNIASRRNGRDGGPRITSGEFGAGDSYELQFQDVGMFSFYDRMNVDTDINIDVVK